MEKQHEIDQGQQKQDEGQSLGLPNWVCELAGDVYGGRLKRLRGYDIGPVKMDEWDREMYEIGVDIANFEQALENSI